MKNILAIYRRELGQYFVSPIAYIVIGVFLIISGYFFSRILDFMIQQSLALTMQAAQFGGPPQEFDVPGAVMQNFFGILSTIILFVIPMLTMGSYAEEKKRGTMELLMTSPLSDLQIVLGKFLATLTLFIIMLAPTLLYQMILYWYSDPRPSLALMASGYAGVLLLGAVLIAFGHFLSSLTENQIVAAILTFGVFLILWVLDAGVRGSSTTWGEILQYLSILNHFEDFARGVIETKSLVLYASFIVLGVFLTLRSVDSLRWRRA
ncbi:MAG: ABC transporter permease subunit [Acidobacteria bacterium]|nr:ABC transporter permease subunit [Acidobacteriota bacterium]